MAIIQRRRLRLAENRPGRGLVRQNTRRNLCRLLHLAKLLELAQDFRITLRKQADDPGIPEQAVHVPRRQDQIEMVTAVVLLDDVEFTFQVCGLGLHPCDLILRNTTLFRLRSISWSSGVAATRERAQLIM